MTETEGRRPDYDFFATPTPSRAGTAPPAFSAGSPSPGQAPFQTGPTTGGYAPSPTIFDPAAALQAAPTGPPPARRSSGLDWQNPWVRRGARMAGPLAVALVLGVFGVGRFSGLFAGGPSLPETILGIPATSSGRDSITELLASKLEAEGQDVEIRVAIYDGPTVDYYVVAATGDISELSGFDATGLPAPTQVGDALCSSALTGDHAICVRSEDGYVQRVFAKGPVTLEAVASASTDAWRQR